MRTICGRCWLFGLSVFLSVAAAHSGVIAPARVITPAQEDVLELDYHAPTVSEDEVLDIEYIAPVTAPTVVEDTSPLHEERIQASRVDSDETRSRGCTNTAHTTLTNHLIVEGIERNFITFLPENYNTEESYQLIFAFHGRTGSNAEVQRYFALEPQAENSIILYPSGLPDPEIEGTRTWSDRGDSGDSLRDYAFFDALLDHALENYCVNRSRVFAVGHSLGASFVNSLACARADVLRGIASLAGGVYSSRSIEEGCSRAIAMMIMHNPHDEHVPFAMGEQVLELYLNQHHVQKTEAENLSQDRFAAFQCQQYHDTTPLIWCPHQQDYVWNGRYYPHGWMQGMGDTVMTFFAGLP